MLGAQIGRKLSGPAIQQSIMKSAVNGLFRSLPLESESVSQIKLTGYPMTSNRVRYLFIRQYETVFSAGRPISRRWYGSLRVATRRICSPRTSIFAKRAGASTL